MPAGGPPFSAFLSLTLSAEAAVRQLSQPWTRPYAIFQGSLDALAGRAVVTDTTISESVRRAVGIDAKTGAATLKALAGGNDSISFLLVALDFSVHADNNASVHTPAEVRFLDHRSPNGTQIRFHVQKVMSGSLILDTELSTVTCNAGLTAKSFAIDSAEGRWS
jgi:hypothetical protein